MRCGSRSILTLAVLLLAGGAALRAETLTFVHQQRYAMGTMFDVLVYHASKVDAERAAGRALDEVDRLDRILSHFKPDNDLARLVREGRGVFVSVDRDLFEVIQESVRVSRLSAGKFDVTIAPLLKTWKRAFAEGRDPSEQEIAAARRCVGYEKIETREPDSIRFSSDCVEIDLGGIGKGFAVDRATAVLAAAGITRALVNAGSSSIAAIGAPPDRSGWPVSLATGTMLPLRDASISTSQQPTEGLGETLDPQAASPARSRMAVSVVARRATLSDALSTTLLMLSIEEGRTLLSQFGDANAYWVSANGKVEAVYSGSR
jgi:thiamine biosynthesis lipoprotein